MADLPKTAAGRARQLPEEAKKWGRDLRDRLSRFKLTRASGTGAMTAGPADEATACEFVAHFDLDTLSKLPAELLELIWGFLSYSDQQLFYSAVMRQFPFPATTTAKTKESVMHSKRQVAYLAVVTLHDILRKAHTDTFKPQTYNDVDAWMEKDADKSWMHEDAEMPKNHPAWHEDGPFKGGLQVLDLTELEPVSSALHLPALVLTPLQIHHSAEGVPTVAPYLYEHFKGEIHSHWCKQFNHLRSIRMPLFARGEWDIHSTRKTPPEAAFAAALGTAIIYTRVNAASTGASWPAHDLRVVVALPPNHHTLAREQCGVPGQSHCSRNHYLPYKLCLRALLGWLTTFLRCSWKIWLSTHWNPEGHSPWYWNDRAQQRLRCQCIRIPSSFPTAHIP
jgi:hypothetical protein